MSGDIVLGGVDAKGATFAGSSAHFGNGFTNGAFNPFTWRRSTPTAARIRKSGGTFPSAVAPHAPRWNMRENCSIDAACPKGTIPLRFHQSQRLGDASRVSASAWLGFTYSLTPRTAFRAAYGRYTQPPNTAFEQYDALQSSAPALLYGT
jgi:hypothetical protein